jgi:hypothetical protein
MMTERLISSAMTFLETARACAVLMPVGRVGERLAIAVIGVLGSGKAIARPVTPRVLSCLPRDLGHSCLTFGSLVAADFLDWCDNGASPTEWTPPLGGLVLDNWFDIESDDVGAIEQVALSLCALHPDELLSQSHGDKQLAAPRSREEARFLESVRTDVIRIRPALDAGFRKAFSLTGKAVGSEVDFVGSSYATCYAAINPRGRIATRVLSASAGLWRLARAREAFGFAGPAVIELTAWVPPKDLPLFSASDYTAVDETIAELREQAKREELHVHSVSDVASASRRLISAEAGALVAA